MELMTSYEEKLGKMEEDEISGEKVLTDRQIEMLQAEDERNYYTSRDENPYRQYQKVTNRLKKFKKKQVIFQKISILTNHMIFFRWIHMMFKIHEQKWFGRQVFVLDI